MKSGLALSILGHSLVFFLIVGVELFKTPRFINPTENVVSIELISEVELFRDSLLSEPVVQSDLDQIQESEENIPEFPDIVQPASPELTIQPDSPEILINNRAHIPDLPQPIEPPGVNIGTPEGLAESIELQNSIPLLKASDFKLPEIPKVTSEYNPIEKPELKVAEVAQESVVSTEQAKLEELEETIDESTAIEASTPLIVTEANKSEEVTIPEVSRDPSTDLLALGSPTRRPRQLVQSEENDLSDLIAEIMESTSPEEITQVAPAPEPKQHQSLTRSEVGQLRSLIEQNWNVGAISSEAKRITLTVRIVMDTTGKPINIELLSQSGGTNGTAVETAFEAARRAIKKGLENGHNLPIDKYDLWKEVIYTFNPEEIRNR